ncbi:HAD family phosphatase [Rhodococcus sp. ACPA4]|uniref:HAD superfamily hydrolase (TIGR01509 family) n=1 Tax=Nocardia globerula TaxID=1818 RepID=A0A652YHQ1_NOCGL|nr:MULTISPECIES: HAD family phosphatase [Rhodococcus]NMD60416.1 HAD family phosphatase [Nocardia globerula]PBC42872.1 HAD family phosphatase [Rhodococcus sp. ACPA4]PVX63469.1 HAD superfamily hydrolase (TIGR01509 family) [Rhodococcus globerulus]
MLQAVFWDMDGTLVDTEPSWFAAERALMSRYGVEWSDEQATALVGKALPDSAAILRAAGADLTIREIVDELVAAVVAGVRQSIEWRPGARELLAQVRDAGIPSVLVTMSEAPLAEAVASALPPGTFQLMVTGDMVEHGKPHPEPYLRARTDLSALTGPISMDRVVAIEDSIPGLASAIAAGAVAVGVPNMVSLREDPGVVLWATLAGKSVTDLEELVAGRAASLELQSI